MTSTDEKELTFMDLVVLQRIGPDTTLERFGSKINSSFFDAANILGTLKLKGYVEIEAAIGASKINVSEGGKAILSMAEEKSSGEIDTLDKGILKAISKGAKDVRKLEDIMNVRSGDLAYHIYKLVKNNYVDYDVRAGNVNMMLTENGFKNIGDEEHIEQPEETDNLGAEIAKDDERKQAREFTSNVSIDDVRRRSKMEHYMKAWGKQAFIAAAIILIILIMAVVYFLL
ncbi:MAG: hypothetical protein ABIG39_02750 [Candidatus Micrarchaeota archaeon]